jgi:glutathione synthase
MKIAFFVNEMATEESEYGTTRLAKAACERGHEVWYVSVGDLDVFPDDGLHALGHRAHYRDDDDLKTFLERAQDDESSSDIVLDRFDAVWVRNEAVDDLEERPWAASAGVEFGRILAERGVTVVNDPTTLMRAGSKLYLHEFPQSIRPRGIISRHPDKIKAFIEDVGHVVLKPIYGAKGRSVFMIEGPDDSNINQIIESVVDCGYATVQEFVPGGDEGDMRVFLLDGELLTYNGKQAAFKRISRGDDPRANISTGAKPVQATLGDDEWRIVRAMKDKLRRDGLFFVGVDIVGKKVVEVNAESPGGLQSAEHFTKHDFGLTICEALERRVESKNRRRSAA